MTEEQRQRLQDQLEARARERALEHRLAAIEARLAALERQQPETAPESLEAVISLLWRSGQATTRRE